MNAMPSVPGPAEPRVSAHHDASLLASKCEQEKAQLARFIHDGLAQQLTVASLELSLWQHEIESSGAVSLEIARAKINNLSALVSSMVATARSISGGLRPRSLDSFGLSAAVEGLVSRAGARLGGGFRFEQQSDAIQLPTDRSIQLYRILESVLAGIDKAPAEGLSVQLQQVDGGVEAHIIANPLPQIPHEAAARLRVFRGYFTAANGVMAIVLPAE